MGWVGFVVGHGWLVSFLDKFCWDKLQLKFFFGGY